MATLPRKCHRQHTRMAGGTHFRAFPELGEPPTASSAPLKREERNPAQPRGCFLCPWTTLFGIFYILGDMRPFSVQVQWFAGTISHRYHPYKSESAVHSQVAPSSSSQSTPRAPQAQEPPSPSAWGNAPFLDISYEQTQTARGLHAPQFHSPSCLHVSTL